MKVAAKHVEKKELTDREFDIVILIENRVEGRVRVDGCHDNDTVTVESKCFKSES